MSANVLRSPQAVRMSVFAVHAFVKRRELVAGSRELARELKALERKRTARLDLHEAAIGAAGAAATKGTPVFNIE